MAKNSFLKSIQERIVEEARKVFDAHREPLDETMSKKLIINIAPSGSFVDKTHNPYLPVTTEEVAKQVADAYAAGAAIWHFHPRDPDTGSICTLITMNI